MKPGHIITDTPHIYTAAIATAARRGMTVTAGPLPPDGIKYLYDGVRPDTDLVELARQLRALDRHELTLHGATLRNVRRPTRAERFPPVLPAPPHARRYLRDTALILTYYGDDPRRLAACRTALEQLLRLNPCPRIVFLELGWGGRKLFSGMLYGRQNCDYIHIQAHERHHDLFQKEAMYNLGATHAISAGCDVLIFSDADSYPTRPDWAYHTACEVRRHPDYLLQPWSHIIDTGEKRRDRPSYAYRHLRGERSHGCPGMAWAMTADMYHRCGGFNPHAMCGAGDCLWVWEHVADCIYSSFPFRNQAYERVTRRDLPKHPLGMLDRTIIHVAHGPVYASGDGETGRGYRWRWDIVQAFGDTAVEDHVYIDDAGLLAWRDPQCALRWAIRRKGECNTDEDVQRVLADSGRGIVTMTRAQFVAASKQDPEYYTEHRWQRYCEITADIRALPVEAFDGLVLEVGPYLAPLVLPCERMDKTARDDTDVVHDARKTPWPDILHGRYSLAIASHVLEHLGDCQSAAIAELARCAEWIVIVLPYMWQRGSASHLHISRTTLRDWVSASGAPLQIVSSTVHGDDDHRQLVTVYRRQTSRTDRHAAGGQQPDTQQESEK